MNIEPNAYTLPLLTQAALTTLLTQPHRHYHNINHVNDCLVELENYPFEKKMFNLIDDITNVTHAIWFHDAIYNPYSAHGINETQSACLYDEYCNPNNDIVYHAILATANHIVDQTNLKLATQILLDIDLAGFGQPKEIYDINTDNIRKEYYKTSFEDFCAGRLNFFKKLQKRSSLYYTDYFKEKYHDISQENIKNDIQVLKEYLEVL